MTGYRYKWVRITLMGVPDEANAKRHVAAGWEPVPPGELPVKVAASEPAPRWPALTMLDPSVSNEERGLRLYRLTAEKAAERDAYYQDVVHQQVKLATESIFWNSDDPRNIIIAKLEDFYNPIWLAEHQYARDTRLADANQLLRRLGLKPWAMQSLRRSLLRHLEGGGGRYRAGLRQGPVWYVGGRSKESMRKLRLDWRMPRGLDERLERYRRDIRTAVSSWRYRGTGL